MRYSGRWWSGGTLFLLKHICGVTHEVRGGQYLVPGAVIYASKHQSAWDTMIYWILLEKPIFVLKRELTRIPFYGQILLKLGSISIDRNGKADALKKMLAKAKQTTDAGYPIIIFPEGTRTLPDAVPQYHPGVAALYSQLKVPVVPVALNSGLCWNKYGFLKNPGRIIIEFLPPIAPGLRGKQFMEQLETQIETKTQEITKESRALSSGAR